MHPESGRVLEVSTTQPGIQFYTANFLDGSLRGKGGICYPKQSGVCLETQNWPNAVNQVGIAVNQTTRASSKLDLCQSLAKLGLKSVLGANQIQGMPVARWGRVVVVDILDLTPLVLPNSVALGVL